MKMEFGFDTFYSQSHLAVVKGAFGLLDRISKTPELTVASCAALLVLCCERWHIEPRDAIQAAVRMMRDARTQDEGHHYDAIKRTLEDGTYGGFRE